MSIIELSFFWPGPPSFPCMRAPCLRGARRYVRKLCAGGGKPHSTGYTVRPSSLWPRYSLGLARIWKCAVQVRPQNILRTCCTAAWCLSATSQPPWPGLTAISLFIIARLLLSVHPSFYDLSVQRFLTLEPRDFSHRLPVGACPTSV